MLNQLTLKGQGRITRVYPTSPIFSGPRKNGEYLYDRAKLSAIPSEGNLSIPLVIDTEFLGMPVHWSKGLPVGRQGITTQIRGIDISDGLIFSHEPVAFMLPRFRPAVSGFHPVDYLTALGYGASLRRVDKVTKGTPVAEFVLYAYFALAELLMIADGEYLEDFRQLAAAKGKNNPQFQMQRRLRASTPSRLADQDYVDLNWLLDLEGQEYAVRVSWVDAGAVHGAASYKQFCEAAGIKLLAKDTFTSEEKSRMLDMAITRPDEFDSYALGDLEVYSALEANAGNFQQVYESLGVPSSYKVPKLTIGSTVRDLFMAKLTDHLGIPQDNKSLKQFSETYLEPASAGRLRMNPLSTAALAAKVEGGRCRNNRPRDIHIKSPIVDLDISGCYGEGQRNQNYYIGQPEILEYSSTSSRNEYWSLRQFLKEYGKDLVPGGWFARVSTSEPLKYPQDFFASWFLPTGAGEDIMSKYVLKMSSDSEQEATEFNEEDGNLKIFNHEIHNGTLTHDGLDWLNKVAGKHQRAELLDKLLVKVAVVYPASWQVETFEELEQVRKDHKGRNTRQRVGKGRKVMRADDGECHAWMAVNLGELMIDGLLANRKVYPKKTPLNTLYKLCVNTLYGDMTSKYFASANVVVGNNITARARALAWYMEKGLYGFQTVTDGCAFELNRVVYPIQGRSVNGSNVVNLNRVSDTYKDAGLRLAPIGGYESIGLQWIDSALEVTLTKGSTSETLTEAEAHKWINQAAMEHLQTLFDVDVLKSPSTSLKPIVEDGKLKGVNHIPRVGQFEFEAKDFYEAGVFHGSANYALYNPNGRNLKMRAYETKKKHDEVTEELGLGDRYSDSNNPASDFMTSLMNPTQLPRQTPFVKEAILKVSDYKNRIKTWEGLMLTPGDSFYKSGLLREFSLSQFTFKTLEQYQVWNKSLSRSKDLYGQSIEDFFTDDEGLLNYRAMVSTVDLMIAEGEGAPMSTLDPSRNYQRKVHPSYKVLQDIRERLKTPATNYHDRD